jgi:hypothetical protein
MLFNVISYKMMKKRKQSLGLLLPDTQYSMKAWGTEGITPTFLTSALDGSEWLASRFTPGEPFLVHPV